MNQKQFVKDYFVFSKRDRTGILCLLALILLIYLLPKFFAKKAEPSFIKEDLTLQTAIDTLQQRKSKKNTIEDATSFPSSYSYDPVSSSYVSTNAALFAFDPNTLPLEGWKQLGLPDKTIRIINNYRTKGGHFYKPEDLQKIWGLPSGFYERVKEYMQITPAYTHSATPLPHSIAVNEETKKEHFAIPDINTADTTAFIALPGIGSKLALRIVSFREKLGGFYSIDQIAQTYGLPDSTFQNIKPYLHVNANGIRKLNVNTVTKEDLKTHPYIKWNLANAIIDYRTQHGLYKSIDELKNIVLIDEETFNKVASYLSL